MDKIVIEYYGIGEKTPYDEYENFEKFIKSLENDYEVIVERQIGGLGGGLYDFIITIITSEEFKTIALSYIASVLFDFSKPIFQKIKSYFSYVERLRKENEQNTSLLCSKVKVEFHDISLNLSIQSGIIDITLLESVFMHLVKNYNLIERSCGKGFEIYIPIVEDRNLPRALKKISKYQTIPDFGYIEVEKEYIFHYWGIITKEKKYFIYDLISNKIKLKNWHNGY